MPHLVERCVSLLMAQTDEDTYIQTFIVIDKISPLSAAREDIFGLMRDNKVRSLFPPNFSTSSHNQVVVSESKDLPEFVAKYPSLAVEFIRATCSAD